MKFKDALDHFCFKGARMDVHPDQPFHYCPDCSQDGLGADHKIRMTDKTAIKLGSMQTDGTVVCPSCNQTMQHSGPRHFADLHITVCLDETQHYPELYNEGHITKEEYDAWFATLTDREKSGKYERIPNHQMMVHLDHNDLAIMDKDPEHFQQLLEAKVHSRLEMDTQFSLQHRYDRKSHDALHMVKHISKFSKKK
jgi:hypothetical protein